MGLILEVVTEKVIMSITTMLTGCNERCSLCSNNLRGLGGGNSTVGVGDKVDSRGSSHASKENLKIELFLL